MWFSPCAETALRYHHKAGATAEVTAPRLLQIPPVRNFASRFGSKSNTVLDLSPSVLYALAAPSTPGAVVEEVVERTAAGQTVTPGVVSPARQSQKPPDARLARGHHPTPPAREARQRPR